jgi:hypothetical protein
VKQTSFISVFALLLIVIGLFSCQKDCEPVDVDDINSIYLQFNTDGSPTSFSPQELDSVYMVRYQPAEVDSFSFPIDTFNLYEIGFYSDDYKIRLGKNHPIGVPGGPPYYSSFIYRFLSRDEDFQVRLQGIELEGNYDEDCNYVPGLKRFQLNDDTLIVTGSTSFVQMFKD